MTRFAFSLFTALALAGCSTAYEGGTFTVKQRLPEAPIPAPTVTVGIVALNDFHGALEPPNTAISAPDGAGGSVAVPAGGAALRSPRRCLRCRGNTLTISPSRPAI